MKTLSLLFCGVLFLFVSCAPLDEVTEVEEEVETVVDVFEEQSISITDEGLMYIIHPDELSAGGPPKDGIPSIDEPRFVTVADADEWIEDNELVLALVYKNVTRVYPLQILGWHEIVNDVVAGDPLLISYCPLCGSGIAYERTFDGEAVEFGTTGKLYNSDLVMYDRKTDTFWTQIGGLAIIGELTGTELVPVSIDTVTWGEWKVAHPDSEVLSQDTGYSRPYGRDPYGNYYFEDYLIFPVAAENKSVFSKTVVFGIEVNGVFKAYKEDDLVALGVVYDVVGNIPVRLERADDGRVTVTRTDIGEEIIKERDFWFAWYAFHPETLLYEA